MALSDESQQLQNPPMALDALLCEEEAFDESPAEEDSDATEPILSPPVLLENDLFWEDDELVSLIRKEEKQISDLGEDDSAAAAAKARRDGVDWILTVQTRFGFSSLTAVLAVNYFDRFVSSHQFQRDKPWMSQLAAVACLSLAAKVEETQVPLLLDLQVEESRFVFEAKTIQRMELLVLSTLKWKMHPVTPISFFNHIARRLGLKTHLHWEFLWSCEKLLLSLIPDIRFARYLPSVLATATMLHVINEIEPFNLVDYQNQLLSVLKINKDSVNECYTLMLGSNGNVSQKRKNMSEPGSPSGVVDAVFSSDSSNDSWASSVEPRFKRSRAQDQKMRLVPPMNSFSVDALTSPR